MKTVFLSSTSKDLEAYRKAAIDVCMRLSLHPIAMEYFNAQPVGATAGSKRELDKADLYVGFFAHRYGYIEDGYTSSVTEIEFDYAGERGLDRLCFIVDPSIPWPPEHTDHANSHKLVAFKDKVNKLIRGQFTSVDKFEALLMASLVEWMGGIQAHTINASSAIFAKRADQLREKPRVFIGRENLINQAYPLLEAHQQVLLQGFGGMGKTALAAALAAKWITDGKGNVLWLKTGSAEPDALFEALARPFNQQQAIASQIGEAKITAINDLLHDCGASLLVLDDCWNSRALFILLESIPTAMPVLMTARQRYPIEGEIIAVEKLSDNEALALLNQHARTTQYTGAELNLCNLLGNHAFAVEIAGKNLQSHSWTSTELITYIKDAPEQLTVPLNFTDNGRENTAKLLEVSLNALDDDSRNVFLAFGAFFAPQMTSEMLKLYFEKRTLRVKNFISLFKKKLDEEINIDKSLMTLYINGLADFLPATDISVAVYRLHDLAYSYAYVQAADNRNHALEICLNYTKHHNQPNLSNFAALRPELDNLLSAASWAFEHGHYAAVERFAWNLDGGSEFLGYQGFYNESIRLLIHAAEAARRSGSKRNESAHLGNLGSAYYALGHVGTSINYFQQALTICKQINYESAIGSILGNLGNAYYSLRQPEIAINYHQQALVISRNIGNKHAEAQDLNNLGLAYIDLGQVDRAIDYYYSGLVISRKLDDKRGQASKLANLGMSYHRLGQAEQAISHYQQSLVISRNIGDRMAAANVLNNIGSLYGDLKEYPTALHYHQEAEAIYTEMDVQDLAMQVRSYIAHSKAKMNADPNSPT